jgi:DNA polymerase III alpha subunit
MKPVSISSPELIRSRVCLVDGLTRTGKSLVCQLFPAFEGIEHPHFLTLLEQILPMMEHQAISTDAARNGFYYTPRIDFKKLEEHWDDKDLMLAVPFYDSFLFKNTLQNSICVPEFTFTKPIFFVEDNDIPFDYIIKSKVEEYSSSNGYEVQKAKSVYYAHNKDFKAYLTFRCINNRSTLNKPNLDHMSSDKFSLESWKEQNDSV